MGAREAERDGLEAAPETGTQGQGTQRTGTRDRKKLIPETENWKDKHKNDGAPKTEIKRRGSQRKTWRQKHGNGVGTQTEGEGQRDAARRGLGSTVLEEGGTKMEVKRWPRNRQRETWSTERWEWSHSLKAESERRQSHGSP